MLQFYDAEDVKGSVSIYESHITFNKAMLKYMQEAYRVRVGLDVDEKKAFVFLYNKDQALSGEFKESSLLKLSLSKTYARISSRAVVSYFLDSFKLELPLDGFIKLNASYDSVKRAIVISVGGEA